MFLCAGTVRACTCVEAANAEPSITSVMREMTLIFRGVVVRSDLLPQHPDMRGRPRYRVLFHVQEYWKGKPVGDVTLHVLDPGTDCLGEEYEVGKEYLVLVSERKAYDYKLDEFFWYGWTDVVKEGTLIHEPVTACLPVGDTHLRLVRKTLRSLGRGYKPAR
jgi:hypothetical protein